MAKYDYLPLKRLEGELQRRKPPGFGGGPKREPTQHGPKLSGEIATVLEEYKKMPSIEGIDPSLILRVELAGFVDEAEWGRLGLVVLSEDQNKTLLLFATDKELTEFRKRIEAYQGELPLGQKAPAYAGLIETIENIGTARPDDRIGESIVCSGINTLTDFNVDYIYLVDVELFHPADDLQADIFVYRLENALSSKGGKVINTYKGDNLLLCRVEGSGDAIREILQLSEVSAIELPPQPDLQMDDLGEITTEAVFPGDAPAEEAIAIAVIDSGINSGHPLLTHAVRGSIVGKSSWTDADEVGHGTSVASMALYGDVGARALDNSFDAPFWVASARVVDEKGNFPKEITVPEIMESSIRSLHKDHGCRIFNISLGDPKLIYSGGRAGVWASKLDELARELDILFVVSSGNQKDLSALYGEQILKKYPSYLLDPSSRILDPATAANVLCVGSIAHANGLDGEDADLVGVRPICEADQPSPFTRTGPGIRGMIKPDLVDYGGTAVWDGPTKSLLNGGKKPSAGVWAFHHKPIDRLFRARSGTSFSAPAVAHKAAIILAENPNAPANFLRAMLALSGEMPSASLEVLASHGKQAPLMVCGNGVPNVENALGSDDSRVILYANDDLMPDHFAVFEVPVPPLFQTTKGTREIKVALAFDPPVRRTRADYLGLTMGWRLLRGTDQKTVFDNFRKWEKAEGDPPEFPAKFTCATNPGPQLREKGTLQCGTFSAKKDMSDYGDTYFVAVWCRRRWAPDSLKSQRFSLAVELRHSAGIALYSTLTVPLPLPLKA
ncbi:S8 family peptidase [Novosphingobium sp. G106]|uniref:S8 family peptidase n=1 Tax=Novosphingobium sp. G106 TaxID=2849500 RepID=UPI001C2DC79C|nr:S8 family peptidase [Novosphingobium sp. G106]MBV1690386.1 S8 family peptidase [Novosphingobium sp. G106]